LIETLVAMSILLIGGASLWWALRRGFEADQRLRRNQIAQEALVAEAERLQGRFQSALQDTAYAIPLAEGRIQVRRQVLDSARRESLTDPWLWEERMRQALYTRPAEVLIEAWYELPGQEAPEESRLSLETGADTLQHGRKRLFLVLPDYQWY
jgi:hypothetical protein